MYISAQQFAETMYAACEESGPGSEDIIIKNAVAYLQSHNQLAMLPEIIDAFERVVDAKQGVIHAHTTTAQSHTIDKATMTELNRIAGSPVKVNAEVNTDMIGGVVVRIGDTNIDASIKQQLSKIVKSLVN